MKNISKSLVGFVALIMVCIPLGASIYLSSSYQEIFTVGEFSEKNDVAAIVGSQYSHSAGSVTFVIQVGHADSGQFKQGSHSKAERLAVDLNTGEWASASGKRGKAEGSVLGDLRRAVISQRDAEEGFVISVLYPGSRLAGNVAK